MRFMQKYFSSDDRCGRFWFERFWIFSRWD